MATDYNKVLKQAVGETLRKGGNEFYDYVREHHMPDVPAEPHAPSFAAGKKIGRIVGERQQILKRVPEKTTDAYPTAEREFQHYNANHNFAMSPEGHESASFHAGVLHGIHSYHNSATKADRKVKRANEEPSSQYKLYGVHQSSYDDGAHIAKQHVKQSDVMGYHRLSALTDRHAENNTSSSAYSPQERREHRDSFMRGYYHTVKNEMPNSREHLKLRNEIRGSHPRAEEVLRDLANDHHPDDLPIATIGNLHPRRPQLPHHQRASGLFGYGYHRWAAAYRYRREGRGAACGANYRAGRWRGLFTV